MRLLRLFSLSFLLASSAFAATPAPRPLTHADFDAWRTITSQVLTRDGSWLGYAFMPYDGDGEVILRELSSGREHRVSVGNLPPPPTTPSEENPERPAPRREVTVAFTSDARFAIATVFPDRADTLAAQRAKKKPAEMPKEGLVIVDLATGQATRVTGVKNFQVPAKGGSWLAWLKEAAPEKPADEKKDSSTPATPAADAKPAPASAAPAATKKDADKDKKYGADLVLRDLAAGTERVFPDVLEYSFARDGRTLVFTVSAKTATANGVFAVTPGDATAPVALAQGPGRYQKLAWNRTQTRLAFVTDRAEHDAKPARFALWHWSRGTATATELVNAATTGLPAGWTVSGDTAPAFSFDGRKLIAATAPLPPVPDERLASLVDEEKVSADLWHWNDDFIPPVQKVRAERERKRSYVALVDPATRRFTQLGDLTLPAVTLNDDASQAFGYDDRAYRQRADYDGIYQDAYLVDTATGARRLLARELGERAGLRWSPGNRWLAWFADQQWFAADSRDGSVRSLTKSLPVAFHNERHDLPQDPPSYGSAGWTQDGESLLVYDRFDLWQVFPDGRPAKNLTAGHGRAEKIELRVQTIEPNEPEDEKHGLDPAKPLYLRGESETTRATGFYRTTFAATGAPERLLWAGKNHRYLGRALQADVLLLSASRFDEYPDLHTTTAAFSAPAKVSRGGDQLAPFQWGGAELLTYRNTEGVELSAALYKPAGFDPAKKYPMIVYIYERLSQIVHTFNAPAPGQNINPSVYTSNGYLVLMPDIAYTVGSPGHSAFQCVMPALDTVVARGFVDENAIGIQGHSWGGYQIAYLVTRTNRFRAAEAGALVSNMTSAYSGIRWGSGRPRQFQYEKTQSRLGRPLAEAPHLYLENSPLFGVDRVTTPLLMIHNDHDDAVPWQQGIEFFLALRRLDKEAYLFNYNGALHGLRRRADLRDYSLRLRQFFDHFLKGAPRPAWMQSGIPYLDRDAEKLRFRDSNQSPSP
jgi:dipeptidyl aminopeptidase/acylaminoacyl peptidase